MAKRLGNISKSSFRFLREASLYAYAGIAILGAFYLSYLAFSYEGEISELQPDVRSELIADSRIDDLTNGSETVDAGIASIAKTDEKAQNSNVIPVATQEEKQNEPKNTESSESKQVSQASITPQIAAKAKDVVAKASEKPAAAAQQSSPNREKAAKSTANQVAKAASTKPSTPSTKFQWVLKSFNNPEFASNWVGKFKEMGLATNVVKVTYDGKTWYRVSHGRYASKSAARADQGKLPKIGDDDYWISSVK